jgi:hypothetical protein
MKLRLDLLEYLTTEDVMEEVLANTHRYKPEPLFSKTGVGSLIPATQEDREQELERIKQLTARLKLRATQANLGTANKR